MSIIRSLLCLCVVLCLSVVFFTCVRASSHACVCAYVCFDVCSHSRVYVCVLTWFTRVYAHLSGRNPPATH